MFEENDFAVFDAYIVKLTKTLPITMQGKVKNFGYPLCYDTSLLVNKQKTFQL